MALKILSVDDSKAVQAFFKQCLDSIDVEIECAAHGAEALEILKERSFDLIFLDWEMPVMDGPATFQKMKNAGVKTPVIMLTSKNNPSDIKHMLDGGIYNYMMKPFTEDLILSEVRRFCEK